MIEGNNGLRVMQGNNPVSIAPAGRVGLAPVGASKAMLYNWLAQSKGLPFVAPLSSVAESDRSKLASAGWSEANAYLNKAENGQFAQQSVSRALTSLPPVQGLGAIDNVSSSLTNAVILGIGLGLGGMIFSYLRGKYGRHF